MKLVKRYWNQLNDRLEKIERELRRLHGKLVMGAMSYELIQWIVDTHFEMSYEEFQEKFYERVEFINLAVRSKLEEGDVPERGI